jgi:hypothetical protein
VFLLSVKTLLLTKARCKQEVLHYGWRFSFDYWYQRDPNLPVVYSADEEACVDLSLTELSTLLVLCIVKSERFSEQDLSGLPSRFERCVRGFQRCPVISVRHFYTQYLTRQSRRNLVAKNLSPSELVIDLILYPPDHAPLLVEMYMVLCNDWQHCYFTFRRGPPPPNIHVVSEPTV